MADELLTPPIAAEAARRAIVPSILMDQNHPYYLAPSDNLGINLFNITFNGTRYNNWHRSVLISLSAKHNLGFITGSCRSPDPDSPLFDHWRR